MTILMALIPQASSAESEGDLSVGKTLYEMYCARCHGVDGAGDGRDAARLYPRPRKLSLGVFKFRSTASGTPPTDEDLFRTMTNGLPGTRMQGWAHLSEEERWRLVHYVKHLTNHFNGAAPQPLVLPPDPGPEQADLAKGKQLYQELGCAACHGQQGRGNGPSSQGLLDDWEQPIQVANLTQGWNYRGGAAPRDILMRLMTGIDGTPMPSYAEAVSGEAIWRLASYVHSLQEAPQWGLQVEAARAEGSLPSSVTDQRWSAAPATDIRLGSGLYRDGALVPGAVLALRAQAMYDDEAVALRLTWDDRTESRQWPPDALAIAFPTPSHQGSYMSLLYWPAEDAQPLDILYWSADTNHAVEYVDTDFNPAGLSVPLISESTYDDGRWTVLMQRPYVSPEVSNVLIPTAVLRQGHVVPMAIAAWDGGHQEQGRHRAASTWLQLHVGATGHAAHEQAGAAPSRFVWYGGAVGLIVLGMLVDGLRKHHRGGA